ncbi:DnaB-like helicase C-terminal domain-containing protein [uncultured Clostridium sp.]|uniref:DnaB-like helicase C-terminal domain-containing protein n=1 Tax=uncultured Clostridium sp. TaxID=59620 RepID=UPI00321785DA
MQKNDIISKIQVEKIKGNVNIVFIDYMGLIEGVKAQDERMKITEVTRRLKALANNLNIPIVILAQAT